MSCQLFKPNISVVSVQFGCSVMSDYLYSYGLQQSRLPCPSPAPGAYSNSCPSSRWPISSSVIPFSSCLQSFPASVSFPMNQFFTSGDQNTGVSALTSVLPMNIQDWFSLGSSGLISLQSNRLSRVLSSTTIQKKLFSTQPSLPGTSVISFLCFPLDSILFAIILGLCRFRM